MFVGEEIWAGLTWALILLPGLGCGIYEILRAPIPNLELLPTLSDESSNLDDKTKPRGFLRFSHLSLGLDVLPELRFKINDNVFIKLLVIPFYLILMSLWFPLLPFIQ